MPVLNAWKRGNVMLNRAAILDKLFEVNPDSFNSLCLEVFHYQYQYNSVYREYCSLMHTDMAAVLHYTQIPFLPVELFKSYKVVTGDGAIQKYSAAVVLRDYKQAFIISPIFRSMKRVSQNAFTNFLAILLIIVYSHCFHLILKGKILRLFT